MWLDLKLEPSNTFRQLTSLAFSSGNERRNEEHEADVVLAHHRRGKTQIALKFTAIAM